LRQELLLTKRDAGMHVEDAEMHLRRLRPHPHPHPRGWRTLRVTHPTAERGRARNDDLHHDLVAVSYPHRLAEAMSSVGRDGHVPAPLRHGIEAKSPCLVTHHAAFARVLLRSELDVDPDPRRSAPVHAMTAHDGHAGRRRVPLLRDHGNARAGLRLVHHPLARRRSRSELHRFVVVVGGKPLRRVGGLDLLSRSHEPPDQSKEDHGRDRCQSEESALVHRGGSTDR